MLTLNALNIPPMYHIIKLWKQDLFFDIKTINSMTILIENHSLNQDLTTNLFRITDNIGKWDLQDIIKSIGQFRTIRLNGIKRNMLQAYISHYIKR